MEFGYLSNGVLEMRKKQIAGVILASTMAISGAITGMADTSDKELVCEKEEHKHTNDCYEIENEEELEEASPSNATPVRKALTCELEEHTHDRDCYGSIELEEDLQGASLQEASPSNMVAEQSVKNTTLNIDCDDYTEDEFSLNIKSDATLSGKNTTQAINIEESCTVTLSDLNMEEHSINIKSGCTVTIKLVGDNEIHAAEGGAAIRVEKGAKLIIDGTGSLEAYGGDSNDTCGSGAGIGGMGQLKGSKSDISSFGEIEIKGGDITAHGGVYEKDNNIGAGAGIGAGGSDSTTYGTIQIHSGNIKAYGGVSTANSETGGGAGIGSGGNSDGVYNDIHVEITGGEIIAHGGNDGAGIGGGANAEIGDIDISGGTVDAHGGNESSGNYGGAGIGAGDNGDGYGIKIHGDADVTAIGGGAAAGIGAGARGSIDDIEIYENAVIRTAGGAGSTRYGAGIGTGGTSGSAEFTGLKIRDNAKIYAYGQGDAQGIGCGTNGTDAMDMQIGGENVYIYAETSSGTISASADFTGTGDYFTSMHDEITYHNSVEDTEETLDDLQYSLTEDDFTYKGKTVGIERTGMGFNWFLYTNTFKESTISWVAHNEQELIDCINRVNAANSGEYTITIAANIDLSDYVEIKKNKVSLVSQDGYKFSIRGNSIKVSGSANVSMTKLTLDGMDKTNTLPMLSLSDNAHAELSDVKIQNNLTYGCAAGVQVDENAQLKMNSCWIRKCVEGSNTFAGGILNNGIIELDGCFVEQCKGGAGAGILNNGTATITGLTTISDNESASNGGGIFNNGKLTLDEVVIRYNKASEYGGGLASQGIISIKGTNVQGNSGDYAGGMYIKGTVEKINSLFIWENTANLSGGGLWLNGLNNIPVDNVVVHDNKASLVGGTMLEDCDINFKYSKMYSNNDADLYLSESSRADLRYANRGLENIDGWYDIDNLDGDAIDVSDAIHGEVFLKASKKKDNSVIYYTVTYDGMTTTTDLVSGDEITIKAAPIKEGYKFAGWVCNGETYLPGDILIVTGNMDFTSLWIPETKVETGSIRIKHIVTGSNADINKEFTYKVSFDDKSLNGIYGEVTLVNGECTFSLKGGELKLISGIPVGTMYSIMAIMEDGYKVDYTTTIGEIAKDSIIDKEFTHTKIENTSGGNSNSNNSSGGNNNNSSSGNNSSSSGGSSHRSSSSDNSKEDSSTWNWIEKDGIWYLNKWNLKQTGWVKADNPYAKGDQPKNSWFLFNSNGEMQTGWYRDDDNNWYYLNPLKDNTQGMMVTGWKQIEDDGNWYYFDTDGKMVTGWKQVGNDWYYFTETNEGPTYEWTGNGWKFNGASHKPMGSMYRNAITPDGYRVGENGKLIK